MLGVMLEAAALAERLQVVVGGVLVRAVEAHDGENDPGPPAAAVLRCLAVAEQPAVVGREDLAVALEALERADILLDAAHDVIAVRYLALLAAIASPCEDARASRAMWPTDPDVRHDWFALDIPSVA